PPHQAHHLTDMAKLHEPRANRKIKAGTETECDQCLAPDETVQERDKLFHVGSSAYALARGVRTAHNGSRSVKGCAHHPRGRIRRSSKVICCVVDRSADQRSVHILAMLRKWVFEVFQRWTVPQDCGTLAPR